MKRFLSLVLAAMMVLTAVSVVSFADDAKPAVDLSKYDLDNPTFVSKNLKNAGETFKEGDVKGYATEDNENFYVLVSVNDATKEIGKDKWSGDLVEFGIKDYPTRSRVNRDGKRSDGAPDASDPWEDEEGFSDNFKTNIMEREGGWYAEFVYPLAEVEKIATRGKISFDPESYAMSSSGGKDDHIRIGYDVSYKLQSLSTLDLTRYDLANPTFTYDIAEGDAEKHKVFKNGDVKGYITNDAQHVYVLYDITDATADIYPTDTSSTDNMWAGDLVELQYGENVYASRARVSRDGMVSDGHDKWQGEWKAEGDFTCDFTAEVSEKKGGWYAEFTFDLSSAASTGKFKIYTDSFVQSTNPAGEKGDDVLRAGKDIEYTLVNEKTIDLDKYDLDTPAFTVDGNRPASFGEGTAKGYITNDASCVFVLFSIDDANKVVYATDRYKDDEKKWGGDLVEVKTSYKNRARVNRYGVRTNGFAKGEDPWETDADFDNFFQANVMERDGGWYAEFIFKASDVAVDDKVSIDQFGTFVQSEKWDAWRLDDTDDKSTVDYTLVETAPSGKLFNDNPNFQKLNNSSITLQPAGDGDFETDFGAAGVTYWVRINGVGSDTFHLYELKADIDFKHYGVKVEKGEDGKNLKSDEDGNDILIRDEKGNLVYEDEVQMSAQIWNHGQDGIRNAQYTIDKSGDYLIYIPFKNYTLSHQFVGKDVITGIRNFSVSADKNTNATIALMGIFNGKISGFKTKFDGETKAGTYTYKQTELSSKATGNATKTAEYYDETLGVVKNKNVKDETGAWVRDEIYDYTETIINTWTYAYVDSVLPEGTSGWADKEVGGYPMIPVIGNELFQPKGIAVTFCDENGGELSVELLVDGKVENMPTAPEKKGENGFTYTFKNWVDAKGEAVDFTKVTENIKVFASYTESWKNPFGDVKKTWYFDAVKWAYREGIMNGMSATEFGTDSTTTRGQVVTILYRMAGSPSVEGLENPFTDIGASQTNKHYYHNAILWAYNKKITTGMTAKTFVPSAAVSRQDLVVFLARYQENILGKKTTYNERTVLTAFADKNDIADYAVEAIKWAIDVDRTTKIISGIPAGDKLNIAPRQSASRAMVVTIMYRFVEGK